MELSENWLTNTCVSTVYHTCCVTARNWCKAGLFPSNNEEKKFFQKYFSVFDLFDSKSVFGV